jgi:two-component sensor histidine kinase
MALHELATNAVKYGALSNASGRVRIDWKHHVESNRLWLVWQETGGPPVAPPRRQGFGMRLIERAIESAGGSARLDFEPQGLACKLEVIL